MSPMTILATFALASPTNESGPVWSAMSPILIGVGDVAMIVLAWFELSGDARRGRQSVSPSNPPHREIALLKPSRLRLGELVATLALAQDNAFGQPLESQLRSCLLATWISEAAGLDEDLRDTVYWVALLRYVGCTGHAHEVATVFGDEIAIRAQTLIHDAANPTEVMRDVMAFATAGRAEAEREDIVRMIQETARGGGGYNISSRGGGAGQPVERPRLHPP